MSKSERRVAKSNIEAQPAVRLGPSNIPKANPADVASIDGIITAAYDSISGPAGEKRNWERERSLYYPGARLIPTAKPGENDDFAPQMLDVDGFIARVEAYFAEHGFYEKEIARRTEQFGNIAHVWSTYESRHNPGDTEPFMRGINTIQLFYFFFFFKIAGTHRDPHFPPPPLPSN